MRTLAFLLLLSLLCSCAAKNSVSVPLVEQEEYCYHYVEVNGPVGSMCYFRTINGTCYLWMKDHSRAGLSQTVDSNCDKAFTTKGRCKEK